MVAGNGKPVEDVLEVKAAAPRKAGQPGNPPVPAEVEQVIDTINNLANDTTVQVTVSKVTPKIGAKARNVIYTIGVILGGVGTVGPIVLALLTGNAAVVGASVVGIAYALSNALAKLNLSKTADDIAKETAV
jgi:hypothetical protein